MEDRAAYKAAGEPAESRRPVGHRSGRCLMSPRSRGPGRLPHRRGLSFPSFFTKPDSAINSTQTEWEIRAAGLAAKARRSIEQRDVEIPKSWSQTGSPTRGLEYFPRETGRLSASTA